MTRYATENLVWFDFESASPVQIKWGAYRYAIEAHAILLSYAIGMGPVQRLDRRGEALTWADFPDDLKAAYAAGKVFCAFNTGFDRAIWNYAVPDAPWLAPQQVIDARATALAHNLPDDLESLATRLTGEGKQKDGKTLIALFCAPRYRDDDKDKVNPFYLKPDTPELLEQWGRFGTYADRDVEKLRHCFKLMQPALTAYDWAAYQANEVVNDNGAGVDLAFCREAARLAAEEAGRIGGRLTELTGGVVTSINQNLRLAQWVHDRLPYVDAREIMCTLYKEEAEAEDDDTLVEKVKMSIARGIVERLIDFLKRKECDDKVLMEVLELREFGASAAPKKFQAILDQNVDGRLYGQFTFNGAGQTGRFSGRGVQLQNLDAGHAGQGQGRRLRLLGRADGGADHRRLFAGGVAGAWRGRVRRAQVGADDPAGVHRARESDVDQGGLLADRGAGAAVAVKLGRRPQAAEGFPAVRRRSEISRPVPPHGRAYDRAGSVADIIGGPAARQGRGARVRIRRWPQRAAFDGGELPAQLYRRGSAEHR